MVTPIYEYNADSPELTSQRDSAAVKEDYVDGFSDLVAFEKNVKTTLLSGITEPIVSVDTSIPILESVDNFNGRIFCSDGSALEYTTDAVNYTAITDFSTNASTSAFWASLSGPSILKVLMIDANAAIVSLGSLTQAYSDGVDVGVLYYTPDIYATTPVFTAKFNTDLGGVLSLNRFETSSTYIAGIYSVPGTSLKSQSLYVSFDNLETWVLIDQHEYASISDNAHCHYGSFYDEDTVFVTYGDGIYSKFVKLTRPASYDPEVDPQWDIAFTKATGAYQHDQFVIVSDKLYIRREGIGANASDFLVFDIATEEFEGDTFLAYTQTSTDGKPYLDRSEAEGNGVYHNGQAFFTHSHDFGTDLPNGGLLVSLDGKTWTTIYRATKGVRRITGFLNNQVVTKVFVGSDEKLALIPIPSFRQLDSTLSEKAQTNLIGLLDDPDAAGDNWDLSSAADSEITAYSGDGRLYESESAIKIKAKDNAAPNPGQWILQSQFTDTAANIGSTKPERILAPQTDDYCVISYDVKFTGYNDRNNFLQTDESGDGNIFTVTTQTFMDGIGGDAQITHYPIINDWYRVFITWKSTTSDVIERALQVVARTDTGSVYVLDLDVEAFIQNVQLYYDTDRVDFRSYIPKGTTKADDYSIAPLVGLGTSWSVTFDWFPINGNLSFPAGVVATLPIATIKGSGEQYLKLYWDRAAFDGVGGGMAFKLTDGTTTISLDAEQDSVAMSWLHNDLLKFGITSDGTNTILYCFNPENGAIHGSAILSNTDATTNIDTPASISLGANDDETIIGTGAFANIRGFNSVLSAGEIEDVFDSVNPLIIRGGRYGGGGYRQTLRPRYAGRGR